MPRWYSSAAVCLRLHAGNVERTTVRRDRRVVPVERIRVAERAESTARIVEPFELEEAQLDPRLRVLRLRVDGLVKEAQRLRLAACGFLEHRLGEKRIDGDRVPRVRLRR